MLAVRPNRDKLPITSSSRLDEDPISRLINEHRRIPDESLRHSTAERTLAEVYWITSPRSTVEPGKEEVQINELRMIITDTLVFRV